MILASFIYNYAVVLPGDTKEKVTIDFDFQALYNLNPGSQIVLRYAAVTGARKDQAGASSGYADINCRLIGLFNETRNINAVVSSPIRVTQSVVAFDGIAIAQNSPFYAPNDAKILMPATFQIQFQPSGFAQNATNDAFEVFMTIGYDIEPPNFVNHEKFNN